MRIKEFSFDRNKEQQFGRKSPIFWGHHKNRNVVFPIAYLQKSKYATDEEFEKLLEAIEYMIKIGEIAINLTNKRRNHDSPKH